MSRVIRDPQRGLNQRNLLAGSIDSKVLQVIWVRTQGPAWAAQTLEKVVRGAVFLEDHNDVLEALRVAEDRPE